MPDGTAFAVVEFARERWGYRFRSRAALHRHQTRRLRRLLAGPAQRTRALAGVDPATPLARLPRTTSAALKADPGEYLAAPLDAERALAEAIEADLARAAPPVIDGIAVGVSSGTSGRRSLFAVDAAERSRWGATVLARLAPAGVLRRALAVGSPPLRIAFALRAPSELYETVGSRRIDFRFIDLVRPYPEVRAAIAGLEPEVVVAPASVLERLARDVEAGACALAPIVAISVAEPLDDEASGRIARALGCPVRQVYQAAEGLLAASCEAGGLHLLEEHCIIERDWLDAERTRFAPIVTDLARTTQVSVRRRLDDVIRVAEGSPERCRCGRITRRIEGIDGRADEVLELPNAVGDGTGALFPDVVRRAFAVGAGHIADWQIEAGPGRWRVGLRPEPGSSADDARAEAAGAIERACAAVGLRVPRLEFLPWRAPEPGAKRRRIRSVR